jgi:ABC-type polysaccharide/polyol phosphate transport system ATPase subunit
LTGREKVILGGLAAGLRRDELEAKYEEIVAFAELGDFIDMPMRTFSAGMHGRLAFAVAAYVNPDILLIDEALSVGDARFRRKSFRRMRELCARARTVVVVGHSLNSVRELCDHALWLHDGTVQACGDPSEVVSAYADFLSGERRHRSASACVQSLSAGGASR